MIDQIILSTNDDPMYVDFWPIVAMAYSRMFPKAKIKLAYLTERSENDEKVAYFRAFGEVKLYRPEYDILQFGQAKMIRFLLASEQGDNICYIDDIDLFPLSRKFIVDAIELRPEGSLLCVGAEVYNHSGTFPISQMTAEGHIWKKFINPEDKSLTRLLNHWNREPMFDPREKIGQINDFAKDMYFSDERLIRRLLHENPVPQHHIERAYPKNQILEHTLDRMDWNLDEEKLWNHGYINAHCCRPYSRCVEEMKPLIEYVEKTYPRQYS